MQLEGMSGSEGGASSSMSESSGMEGGGSYPEQNSQESPGTEQRESATDDYRNDYYRNMNSFRRKEQEFLAERKRWSSVEKELREAKEQLAKYQGVKDQIERDPNALLQAYGLDIDKFGEIIRRNMDGTVTKDHLSAYDQKIKELQEENRKLREEFTSHSEQLADKSRLETYNSFTGEINDHIEQVADKYPLLAEEAGREQIIFDVIRKYWEQTKEQGQPRMLSIDDACQYADKLLANQYMGALQSERRRKALGIDFQKREQAEERSRYSETLREEREYPSSLSSRFSNRAPPPATKSRYETIEERDASIKRMLFGQ